VDRSPSPFFRDLTAAIAASHSQRERGDLKAMKKAKKAAPKKKKRS